VCETALNAATVTPVSSIDEGTPAKRTATVLHYFKTGAAPPRTVHPPAHHRAMVERIYARGGLPRSMADAGGPAELDDGAQVRVEVFPVWSEAALRVTAYGRDLPGLVAFRLRELKLRRIDWISLDLPLSDPAARLACAPLEALGFFFAGIIPELDGDDVLRLQYLHDVEADVDSVQIASDFGAELFAYVVAAMRARPELAPERTPPLA